MATRYRWSQVVLLPLLPVLAACSQILMARSNQANRIARNEPSPILRLEAVNHECNGLSIDRDGVATRRLSCELHQSELLSDDLLRMAQWKAILIRFAPFEFRTAIDRLIFAGDGQEVPSAAWQRAIHAWATVVQKEQELGRGSASGALAMNWRRELPGGSGPDRCAFLQVEVYGYAYASRANCEGGDPELMGHGWIDDDLWTSFDIWYQTYAPEQAEPEVFFSAQGTTPMTEANRVELEVWAMTLYEQLTGQ